MSDIDELIERLAPKGVPFKTLGDIAELVRGNGMPKSDLTDEGVGAIHYGQIYTRYGAWTTSTISYVTPDAATKLAKVEPGDIIITNTSENIEDVGKAVAWLGEKPIVTGGHATVIKHHQDPKFLSYWFQSESFFAQKKALATGTKVIDVSAKQLARVRIPVPPVEVQREIVRVLDLFGGLVADLTVRLDTELLARQRQRQFVVSQIIAGINAKQETLGDLGKWRGGVTPSKSEPRYWESGTIPWLASMDVSESEGSVIRGRVTPVALAETSLRVFPSASVIVVMRSNILRRRLPVGITAVETTINQDVKALSPRDGIDPEYVYQVLRATSEQIRAACVRADGSMAAVDSKAFFDWSITIPSFQDQKRIASQLSSFEAVVSKLSINVSAERSARRKQYEYYRDRLLTFKELAA